MARTTFRINGKKASRKQVEAIVGKDWLKRIVRDAWEDTMREPGILNAIWIGAGMLTIDFSC